MALWHSSQSDLCLDWSVDVLTAGDTLRYLTERTQERFSLTGHERGIEVELSMEEREAIRKFFKGKYRISDEAWLVVKVKAQ